MSAESKDESQRGEYHSASEFEYRIKVLYKYITHDALMGLLKNGMLKVSYRHDTNDPFEMLPVGYLPNEYVDSHG